MIKIQEQENYNTGQKVKTRKTLFASYSFPKREATNLALNLLGVKKKRET